MTRFMRLVCKFSFSNASDICCLTLNTYVVITC